MANTDNEFIRELTNHIDGLSTQATDLFARIEALEALVVEAMPELEGLLFFYEAELKVFDGYRKGEELKEDIAKIKDWIERYKALELGEGENHVCSKHSG